ncbi:MAG: hypothetical protein LQ346_006752 [Caloplaca aetnensis]|nr:MAG: hypothetical protein LQ346_006752 [Caloplaca aetnensis]
MVDHDEDSLSQYFSGPSRSLCRLHHHINSPTIPPNQEQAMSSPTRTPSPSPSPADPGPPILVAVLASSSSSSSNPSTPTTTIIFTVQEALLDLIAFPTAVIHLRGVFAYLDDAVATAWSRINRGDGSQGRDWAVPPAQIYMHGKEMYVVAVEADGCLLAVWVEGRVVRRGEMGWEEITEEGRGLLE